MNPVLQAEFADLDWETVTSSNLRAIAYVPDFARMWVWFKGGGRYSVYVYLRVPQQVYDGLLNASSKGSYLHRFVKGNYGYIPFQ